MKKRTDHVQEPTPFCGIPEAARRSGLSEFFIRRGCRDGSIPCIRTGEKYMVDFNGMVEAMSRRARGEAVGE